MTDTEKSALGSVYFQLLHQQQFNEGDLDYTLFKNHEPTLRALASMSNSGISVFDVFRKEHIFYSPNYCTMLGYDVAEIMEKGQYFLDSKIHPEDFVELTENGISILKLFYNFSVDEKNSYKLLNEYRVLNSEGKYVRLIEQHQVLELDKSGNLWLTLSTIDISPNQNPEGNIKSQLLNFKTGSIIDFKEENTVQDPVEAVLSQREIQILKMVKDGFLSKEISSKLAISVHTVNTHRQRMLGKLGANNSLEAIAFASRQGLV